MRPRKVKRYFELSQSDGLGGEYYRCTFEARDMENALQKMRRSGDMNLSYEYKELLQYEIKKDCVVMSVCQERGCDFNEYRATMREITPEQAGQNYSKHGR